MGGGLGAMPLGNKYMNYRNRPLFFQYILIIIAIYSIPIISQTIERTMDQGKIEVGVDYRYFKRDFPDDYKQVKWDNGNLVLRYGITDWLTVSFEGFIGKMEQDNFPNRNYHSYRLGFGSAIKIITIDKSKIIFGIHYIENLDFDKSESNYHKLQKSFITALGVQQYFNFSFMESFIFIYPVYVQDKVFEYTPRFHTSDTSLNNFGVIVGADFLAYHHFHFIAEILYADYYQPRFGIGYIF
jgi:hypothetical protein